MLPALHPRNLGTQDRLELAGVQVAPTSRSSVVSGAGLAANRAGKSPLAVGDFDFDGLLSGVQLDAEDLPGRLQAEDGFIQGGVLHGSKLPDPVSRFHTRWGSAE